MSRLHVTAIGDALVDILAHCDEAFIARTGVPKGSMQLMEEVEAEALYAQMGPSTQMSGGSAANTIACMAAMGSACGFIGRVRDDALGRIFAHDIRALGVDFPTEAANEGPTTGRCYILITPDGERTMMTYLGIAQYLSAEDLQSEQLARSDIFYIEGYMWSKPETKDAIVKAIQISHRAGNRAALTLSDTFCVNMYRDEFNSLIDNHIDILFANEHEIMALTQAGTLDDALQSIRGRCEIAAITRSEKGAVILKGDEVHIIDAEPVAKVIDATGAGDAFAAGFLHGLTSGHSLADCGRMGVICATSVIAQVGPRPQEDLKALIAAKVTRA
jgi:sugar/nucleoside kinase (ribokinase family)